MLRLEIIVSLILIFSLIPFGLLLLLWGKRVNAALAVHNYAPKEWHGMLAFASFLLAGLVTVILLICLVPFQPKYWVMTNEIAEVTRVETQTAIDGSGSNSQIISNVVLTLDSGRVVIIEDPRALNIEVGDDVNLRCMTDWVYGGSDVITCVPN